MVCSGYCPDYGTTGLAHRQGHRLRDRRGDRNAADGSHDVYSVRLRQSVRGREFPVTLETSSNLADAYSEAGNVASKARKE
jgi:hypothetical protein